MKNLMVCLAISLLTGCEQYEPKDQFLSTIIDLTDTPAYLPKAEEILSHLKDGQDSDGLTLSLRYVAETRYSSRKLFSLGKGETGLLSNEDARRRKRKVLLKQFSDTLQVYNNHEQEIPRSEILRLVVDELKTLSKVSGTKAILLYSNLKEHSSLLSLYNSRDVAKLYASVEKLANGLAEKLELPDELHGITLHILYVPTLEQDRLFTAMVELYRELLEPRGVSVIVGNTNQITIK